MRRLGVALAVAGAVAVACTPIRPIPFSQAPANECPCEAYPQVPGTTLTAACATAQRCEVTTPGRRPSYPFFVVINEPDTSAYGPGMTHVLYSSAFTSKPPAALKECKPPNCLSLGALSNANGHYLVSASVSSAAGYPLADGQAIPARVMYSRIGNLKDDTQPDFPPGLPLDKVLVFPQPGAAGAEFSVALPSGRYRAAMYPEPPFDALFPPRIQESQGIDATSFVDDFTLNDGALDSRDVTVLRSEGLDGWQTWLAQISASDQRISTIKTLKGTTATVHYDTVLRGATPQQPQPSIFDRRDANGQPLDDVALIIAPPTSYIGVPRFVTRVFSGSFGQPSYPSLPSPQPVRGNVAEPTTSPDSPLLGYAAHLTFDSISITTLASNPESTLLHYSTDLGTDDRGQFATVLPPGSYNVTIEPAPGTDFAIARQIVTVDANVVGNVALRLQPPRRTTVRGRVLLADNRPLVEADILATPRTPTSPQIPKPRPARTTTQADGRFSLNLDQGPYTLTAIPKAGSGFPNVVTLAEIPADEVDLTDIRVWPPAPLTQDGHLTIKDASRFEVPAANALVRIFAIPGVLETADFAKPDLGDPVEIGNGRTDANGVVEILLAPGPL